ncbi:hypothetical protein G9A89_010999 [Geosiphon pyriformis]|nr:hypothetical protein G9A89_010999 [Geosiphon pyriformis]
MKQNTTQVTPFELVYGKTATLPVKIEVSTYPTEPITEENFKNTLIGNKVLLHRTKAEKQWNGPFHIEEILRNRAYKLRLNNKILTKAAHRDRLKPYHHIALLSTSNIPQLGVQRILVQPDEIPRDLEPIIIIDNNTSN